MIFYGLLLGVVVGVVAGGSLSRLATIEVKWWWAGLAAIAFQVLLFSTPIGSAIGPLAPIGYVLSTAAVLAAVLANLHLPGFRLMSAGAITNLAAVVTNGGYMPSTEEALQLANRGHETGYSNSALFSHPNLAVFTDIFAIPSWIPLSNVFSIGDVLIAAGLAVVVAQAMLGDKSAAATT